MATMTEGKTGAVSTAIHEVLGAILSKNELTTPEGVKQGINNSGAFLEAKLANQLTPQGDLKGHLLTLVDALQKAQDNQAKIETPLTTPNNVTEAIPTKTLPNNLIGSTDKDNALLNKAEGAIARIVVDQLASLPQNENQQNIWQIEIPFTHGQQTDTAKLKINRESKDNHQPNDKANWSVVLELNPAGMGTIHSKISLVDDRIDTYFWSDQQKLTALVREHLDLLANRYTEAGLSVGQINTLDGPASPTNSPALPTLLDEYI